MLKFKQHISLLFLAIFIVIKLAGLHEFTHSDDEQHNDCDICEFVITSNTTPFIATASITLEAPILLENYKTIFYEYNYQFVQNQTENSLFCRPPPTI